MSVIARGMNAFETDEEVTGKVKYLGTPQDVLELISSGDLADHILLVQGGTTTFLTPALSMGATGVLTMSGAPESHLGILSREFQVPCIMTVHLTDSDSRYEVGVSGQYHFDEFISKLEGKTVRLNVADDEMGEVHLEG